MLQANGAWQIGQPLDADASDWWYRTTFDAPELPVGQPCFLCCDGLATLGGLHGLVRSTCEELSRVTGIGGARAARILAALEMGRRTLAHAPQARLQIQAPPFEEEKLLRVARMYEAETDWHRRRPVL